MLRVSQVEELSIPLSVQQFPARLYRRLSVIADEHDTLVEAVLVEVVRIALREPVEPPVEWQYRPPIHKREERKRIVAADVAVELRELYDLGYSDCEISRRLGMSRRTVWKWRTEEAHLPARWQGKKQVV